MRNHACDYKTRLTTRAGKPHRSLNMCRNVLLNLSNCPCNYSLLSPHILDIDFISIQSISSDGLFFMQRNIYIYCSLFLLMDNKRRGFIFYFKLCFSLIYQLYAASADDMTLQPLQLISKNSGLNMETIKEFLRCIFHFFPHSITLNLRSGWLISTHCLSGNIQVCQVISVHWFFGKLIVLHPLLLK